MTFKLWSCRNIQKYERTWAFSVVTSRHTLNQVSLPIFGEVLKNGARYIRANMVTIRHWRYTTRNKIIQNGIWIKRKPVFSTIYLVPKRMIMVKAWLLAKCMHTLMFRGGVGQEMEVEHIKNWKYIGFSIKCSRVHGYATDMTWICQLVSTYSVGMPSNANSPEPPRNLLQGITPFCSKPKTLLLPRLKKKQ